MLDDNIKNKKSLLYWSIIFISVLLGIFIRLKGLGTWPLALDEYYIIQSVENILKHNLPQFINGGYYDRGILMQYMIAPLLILGIKPEFAGRIFPLISNLLAIPALYLIAKKVGNQLIAVIAVVIFSFSVWEIEFARFARMYAPFQTIFLWYIYFLLKDFVDKKFDNYKWLLLLSFLSIIVFEGSIFLVLLNFVSFVLYRKINYKYFIGSIIVFAVSIFFNSFNFRVLNEGPIFSAEYLAYVNNKTFDSPIKLPKVLLPYSFASHHFIFLTPIIIGITIFLMWLIIKNLSSKNLYSIFSLIFLGICAILNQFGLFLLAFLIFVFWDFVDEKLLNKKNIGFLGLIFIINLIYWYSYGILSKEWFTLFNDFSSYSFGGITKRIIVAFFNFPDNYYSLIMYLKTLPLLTLFAGITLLIYFAFILFNKDKNENIKFLSGIVIFMSVAATIPELLYEETRYTFFLVPILLILVLYSVYFISGKLLKKKLFVNISFISLILITFLLSRDFNYYHLTNIDHQDVNYRMIYTNNNYKRHLYRRWDIMTPINYVKKNLGENDIIMIDENSMKFYLPRVDYFNFNYRHQAFSSLTVENGTRERWSNAKLIYTNKDLINFIQNRKKTIWFLVYPEFWFKEIDFYKRYKNNLVYQGVDGMIKVFKFPKPDNN